MSKISEDLGLSPKQLAEIRQATLSHLTEYDYEAQERNSIPVKEFDETLHVSPPEGKFLDNTANNLTSEQQHNDLMAKLATLDMTQDIFNQRLRHLEERLVQLEGKK